MYKKQLPNGFITSSIVLLAMLGVSVVITTLIAIGKNSNDIRNRAFDPGDSPYATSRPAATTKPANNSGSLVDCVNEGHSMTWCESQNNTQTTTVAPQPTTNASTSVREQLIQSTAETIKTECAHFTDSAYSSCVDDLVRKFEQNCKGEDCNTLYYEVQALAAVRPTPNVPTQAAPSFIIPAHATDVVRPRTQTPTNVPVRATRSPTTSPKVVATRPTSQPLSTIRPTSTRTPTNPATRFGSVAIPTGITNRTTPQPTSGTARAFTAQTVDAIREFATQARESIPASCRTPGCQAIYFKNKIAQLGTIPGCENNLESCQTTFNLLANPPAPQVTGNTPIPFNQNDYDKEQTARNLEAKIAEKCANLDASPATCNEIRRDEIEQFRDTSPLCDSNTSLCNTIVAEVEQSYQELNQPTIWQIIGGAIAEGWNTITQNSGPFQPIVSLLFPNPTPIRQIPGLPLPTGAADTPVKITLAPTRTQLLPTPNINNLVQDTIDNIEKICVFGPAYRQCVDDTIRQYIDTYCRPLGELDQSCSNKFVASINKVTPFIPPTPLITAVIVPNATPTSVVPTIQPTTLPLTIPTQPSRITPTRNIMEPITNYTDLITTMCYSNPNFSTCVNEITTQFTESNCTTSSGIDPSCRRQFLNALAAIPTPQATAPTKRPTITPRATTVPRNTPTRGVTPVPSQVLRITIVPPRLSPTPSIQPITLPTCGNQCQGNSFLSTVCQRLCGTAPSRIPTPMVTPIPNPTPIPIASSCQFWCAGCGGFCGDSGVRGGKTCNEQQMDRCNQRPCYEVGTCRTSTGTPAAGGTPAASSTTLVINPPTVFPPGTSCNCDGSSCGSVHDNTSDNGTFGCKKVQCTPSGWQTIGTATHPECSQKTGIDPSLDKGICGDKVCSNGESGLSCAEDCTNPSLISTVSNSIVSLTSSQYATTIPFTTPSGPEPVVGPLRGICYCKDNRGLNKVCSDQSKCCSNPTWNGIVLACNGTAPTNTPRPTPRPTIAINASGISNCVQQGGTPIGCAAQAFYQLIPTPIQSFFSAATSIFPNPFSTTSPSPTPRISPNPTPGTGTPNSGSSMLQNQYEQAARQSALRGGGSTENRIQLSEADIRLAAAITLHESSGGQYGTDFDLLMPWVVFNLREQGNTRSGIIHNWYMTAVEFYGEQEGSNGFTITEEEINKKHEQYLSDPAYRQAYERAQQSASAYQSGQINPLYGAEGATSPIVIPVIDSNVENALETAQEEIKKYYADPLTIGGANPPVFTAPFLNTDQNGYQSVVVWQFPTWGENPTQPL